MVLLKRTAFKGKRKIQNHWVMPYIVFGGQPYAGLPVSRSPQLQEKVRWKLYTETCYSHLEATLRWGPENERSQQDADRPQDCILTVSDDGVPETEVVLTNTKPVGEGDAIHVQYVKTLER